MAESQAIFEAFEQRLVQQERKHVVEVQRFNAELQELRRLCGELEEQNRSLDGVGRLDSSDHFTKRVEWTINKFSAEAKACQKGQPIWSPKFRAAGIDGVRLEFLPKGREKSFDGFCSLFLWCPSGVSIKYQLWVGNYLRAPDQDEYLGEIGHGHSNFCPVEPEVDRDSDSLKVGVDFLEVIRRHELEDKGLTLISWPLQRMVAKEAEVLENRGVSQVVWKINKISEHLKHYPRGASLCSKTFTAAGISEILLEFYPNGSQITKKDGFCSFYLRCPDGVSVIVTLFVGKVRKGPIKTTFDSTSGKGLPDFCLVEDEINRADDSLEVGIELQNRASKTLTLVT
eukprot:gb/GFBE01045995.1/.p1 GENE.gb/GFBE01045995.1/~~gb/GFBE01045995.1/.p1  ORF type:complete len:342 (+),score=81.20 gb/GFBE01045995.1/:1-1026(+)